MRYKIQFTLAGNVTLGDILEILPWEDPVVVLELDGAAIWDALEAGLSMWPAQEGYAYENLEETSLMPSSAVFLSYQVFESPGTPGALRASAFWVSG